MFFSSLHLSTHGLQPYGKSQNLSDLVKSSLSTYWILYNYTELSLVSGSRNSFQEFFDHFTLTCLIRPQNKSYVWGIVKSRTAAQIYCTTTTNHAECENTGIFFLDVGEEHSFVPCLLFKHTHKSKDLTDSDLSFDGTQSTKITARKWRYYQQKNRPNHSRWKTYRHLSQYTHTKKSVFWAFSRRLFHRSYIVVGFSRLVGFVGEDVEKVFPGLESWDVRQWWSLYIKKICRYFPSEAIWRMRRSLFLWLKS